jgi:hypothetical protein
MNVQIDRGRPVGRRVLCDLGRRCAGNTEGANVDKAVTRFFGRRNPLDRCGQRFALYRRLRNGDVPKVADLAMLLVKGSVMPVACHLRAKYADR